MTAAHNAAKAATMAVKGTIAWTVEAVHAKVAPTPIPGVRTLLHDRHLREKSWERLSEVLT